MRRVLIFDVLLLAVTATCLAGTTPQTLPWRVAIAGGQAIAARGGDIPGYLSLLALHGLPRVRIDETELTNLDRLRQFDVVIAAWGRHGSDQAMSTLEQFAREGDAAGLALRTRGAEGLLIALVRDGDGLRPKAYRQGQTLRTLVDSPVPGTSSEWHALAARCSGLRLQIRLDGKLVAEVFDGLAAGGTAGLYARGKQPAEFSDFAAWVEPGDDRLADEVTPEFAGVIDRNTWAGLADHQPPGPCDDRAAERRERNVLGRQRQG